MEIVSSTPSISEFEPLPKQLEVIQAIRGDHDPDNGTLELLLSGSVGSAKSIVIAHLATTHCLQFPNANFGIGRLALPDLKETLCKKIREHLFNEGVDYRYSETTGDFKFSNGSKIEAVSWADGNLAKLGSHEYSAFAIEELTENKTEDFYDVILQRTNRIPHVKEPFVISATNPNSPRHWAYKKIIESKSDRVKTFFSNTFDNPYLPKAYIDSLIERLDPKMARRMVWGEWIEIDQERIYYAYDSAHNFKKMKYKFDPRLPLRLHFDFNIGEGKPLSMVCSQFKQDKVDDMGEWHFFDEVIVDGQRTRDSLEEAESRGLLELGAEIIIHGDATGRNRDTRGVGSDYDIIENFLSNFRRKNGQKVIYKMRVPRSNPPLRERHNISNAYMLNAAGARRLFVYEGCPTLDEGFRLTALKQGGHYLEDDKPRYQHCTTAATYGILDEWFEIESRRKTGSYSIRG